MTQTIQIEREDWISQVKEQLRNQFAESVSNATPDELFRAYVRELPEGTPPQSARRNCVRSRHRPTPSNTLIVKRPDMKSVWMYPLPARDRIFVSSNTYWLCLMIRYRAGSQAFEFDPLWVEANAEGGMGRGQSPTKWMRLPIGPSLGQLLEYDQASLPIESSRSANCARSRLFR
jgi:hypothetical protein